MGPLTRGATRLLDLALPPVCAGCGREGDAICRRCRPGIRSRVELPAGGVDEGESPEEAARRECHEEIGLVPATTVRLGAMYPTPGYCDEEMVFFRLSGLERTDEQAAMDEDEDIEVKIFDLRDVREMLRRGEIQDMKTLVGMSLLG